MPSVLKLEFRRGCLSSTREVSATRRSVCVMRTLCVRSMSPTIFSRYALSAVASISRVTKKWGTVVQLWVVRSAMRRPRVVGTSRFADFAGAEALEAMGVAAAWISEARISPLGPEPRRPARSTPNSLARRRAFGEILALAAADDSGTLEATGAAWDSVFPRAAGAAAPDSCSVGGFSPGAMIQAMVWPTGMSAPTIPVTPARMPSAVASTSITALSVSISRRGSPLVTRSPSFFRQAMSLPVSCAISRAGITTLKAIVFPVLEPVCVCAVIFDINGRRAQAATLRRSPPTPPAYDQPYLEAKSDSADRDTTPKFGPDSSSQGRRAKCQSHEEPEGRTNSNAQPNILITA